MEYDVAINEVLMNFPTWMNLESIRLSERSKSQRITYFMIPFLLNAWYRRIHGES